MYPTEPKATRRYLDGPFGQMHAYDTGGDGMPLLLLHQAPTSSLDFGPAFPAFARAKQRIIAIDMPGFGMSDAPPTPATISDYVASTLAVMDGLQISKADVLGHHTGNRLAVDLASSHPDRANKIILYGPTASTQAEREAMWDRLVPHEKEGRIHKPEPGGEHLAAQFRQQEYYGGPVVAHRLLLTGLMAGPKWWYAHNAALLHDSTPALLALKHQIMFLTHPGEMGEAKTLELAKLKPEATLVVLKTNGAMAMDTDPDEFVEAVVSWLRRA